jgi:hypothetical protein
MVGRFSFLDPRSYTLYAQIKSIELSGLYIGSEADCFADISIYIVT